MILRRRLLWRTGFFLVGSVLFVPVSEAFPPLELDGMWVFSGILFFVAFGLGLWIVQRLREHKDVEILRRIYFGLLPVPWILAGMLFFNGKLDTGQPKTATARVIGKFNMPGVLVRPQRLEVISWRYGHQIERLPVTRDDFDRFQVGDTVVVELEDGAMGVPWVYGVHLP